jgi:hypothetical protein
MTDASAITVIATGVLFAFLAHFTLFTPPWRGWAGGLACISLTRAQGCTP